MKSTLTSLRFPALIGLLAVLPFMAMELVNRRSLHEGFPVPLFAILWLLAVIFVLALLPLLRSRQAGHRSTIKPAGLLLRAAALIVTAWLFLAILRDQMPCFLGVPLCD